MWLIISGAVGIMIAIVLLIARWRIQLQASEPCAGPCCALLFPPFRRRRLCVVAARAQRERAEAQREDATYNMPAEIENEILRRCW